MDDSRRDYLDGWRGLAILFVLVAHFAPIPGIDSGRLGVDIFFVLSGLLMSELLFVKRTPLGLFYRRRISRILPAFLTFVCLVYGIGYLAGHRYPWTDFASTLTFLRSYVPVSPGIWEIDLPTHHLWSLNVEEHCYVFMSLMVLTVRKHAAVALIVCGLAAIAIHVAYIRVPGLAPVHYELHTEVVASTLLLSAGYRLVRGKVWSWMPVAAFVLVVLAYSDLAPWWSVMLLSPFLLAFTINHLGDAPEIVRRALAWKPLRYMGLWSYSIYLWQQPFYMYDDLGIWSLPCAMGLALLSYYGLEKPVRGWLNTHWKSVRRVELNADDQRCKPEEESEPAPHRSVRRPLKKPERFAEQARQRDKLQDERQDIHVSSPQTSGWSLSHLRATSVAMSSRARHSARCSGVSPRPAATAARICSSSTCRSRLPSLTPPARAEARFR